MGGPKFTVSATYEGMFKEELDAAAQRYPEVAYQPLLIDATFALLLQSSGEALVVPALNRDGDLLLRYGVANVRQHRRVRESGHGL